MTAQPRPFIPLALLFRALSDPVRLAILFRLAECEMPVGVLAGELALAQPTVSQHLGVLRQAGLLASRRSGTHTIYTLQSRQILELLAYAAPLAPSEPGPGGRSRGRNPFQAARGRAKR